MPAQKNNIKCTSNSWFIIILTILIGFGCKPEIQQTTDSFMDFPDPSEFQDPLYPAPDWLRDAVIVEIPIRAFNHPDYNNPQNWENEFGNASYLSVIERLDFLKEMGVNVICLYTIYYHTPGTNLYALRHHEADPTLGSIDDVKTLINSAHEKGFKVISNTNAYGVAQASPMIDEHPDWFLNEEYDLFGQRVFDVNNPEVVKYIIDTHVWWCTEIGLDGWRIDVAGRTFRKYIWDPILEKSASKGKRLLLATENGHLDSHIRGAGWRSFQVSLDMEDPKANWEPRESRYTLKDYLKSTADDPYALKDISSHNSMVPCPYNHFPDSCSQKGAYQIQGSRFLFGHNLLFAPFVPWMMVGELFNPTHYGVPGVLNHRLMGKMLHSYINWDDLEEQQEVINDFKKISNIRNDHMDVFHNNRYETNLVNIPFTSSPEIQAKPYARFIPGEKAALVIGNNNPEEDVTFMLNIPLEMLGFGDLKELLLTDLWTGKKELFPVDQLSDYQITVPRDKSPGGGVRVLLITKN
jgi:hypothetical protein